MVDARHQTLSLSRPPSLVDQMYRDLWGDVCRFVSRRFGAGPPEPEEVAQIAFAKLAALDRLSDIRDARAFLFQCARNAVLDYHRHESVRTRLDPECEPIDVDAAAVNWDAERVLSARERLAIVDAAIERMEPRRRKVLIMHAIHELSYSEIARRLGLSPTRVTQLVASAVAECNKALRQADGEEGERA